MVRLHRTKSRIIELRISYILICIIDSASSTFSRFHTSVIQETVQQVSIDVTCRVILCIVRPCRVGFLGIVNNRVYIECGPFIVVLPVAAIVTPEVEYRLVDSTCQSNLQCRICTCRIGVVANLAEAHLFLVVPVRILLNDVCMSQCPDDVVRFYTSFRVGNHRSRTFAGTLCTIKLSINGVEFLLGHTTFFSLVVNHGIHHFRHNHITVHFILVMVNRILIRPGHHFNHAADIHGLGL